MDIDNIKSKFVSTFDQKPQLFRAPGRVNIIGEHTDYNDGLVLPFSIEQAIYFAASPRTDREIHIHALDLNERTIIKLDSDHGDLSWTRFFRGALRVLQEDKHDISGFNVMINGDIPFGAGISSSSALTCGFLYTIQQLFQLPFTKQDIVFMASRAENGTGVNGGKMDQFAICMGQSDKAILLDCRDYSYELIPSAVKGAKWYLFNTNVEHNLAETEYNDRRKDCELALASIREHNAEITNIRELTLDILDLNIDLISKKEYDRLSHVIMENTRVRAMVKALTGNDLDLAGQLLYESHASLDKLYEVSCEELNFVVSSLKKREDCIGARMMGGGFGGSVIALLKDHAEDFHTLSQDYKESFNLDLQIIPVVSKDGLGKHTEL